MTSTNMPPDTMSTPRETPREPREAKSRIRLSALSHGGGCACKLGSAELAQVLRRVGHVTDPAVLVDASTADDAAVYRLTPDRALVATTDFFTPIVDDPYDFGRIAATNALSDIYAMGGRPLFALNLVAFPRNLLRGEDDVLGGILRGGTEAARTAGIAIVGGHSIDDAEPKYGLAVIGEVHPDRIIRNVGARDGDAIVLTKPLGTGIISNGIKRETAPADAIAAAVASMTRLNDVASRAMIDADAHAATDVTGFGLMGHLLEMLRASAVGAHIEAGAVPILTGARELAQAGTIPGGTRRNLQDTAGAVQWSPDVDEVTRMLLCDAQTSGGLLISLASDRADALVDTLVHAGHSVARIGTIVAGESVIAVGR